MRQCEHGCNGCDNCTDYEGTHPMTTLEDAARDVMPRPLKLAKVIRGVGVNGIVNKWLDEAADAIESLHAEVEALRGLAATCYAGLGGEHNLPVEWLDALNNAANGEPFSTEGLLPYTATPPAQEDGNA